MATKRTTKKETKKNETTLFECMNDVTISGTIQKILTQSEKCVIFTLDSTRKTPKGNFAHTWATICEFEPELVFDEGDVVEVCGYLATDSYEKNGNKIYQLRVIAGSIETIEEVPFN